ncbi:MAG: hypothetical protein V7676_02570 [Parasphingorhabdus sp.]
MSKRLVFSAIIATALMATTAAYTQSQADQNVTAKAYITANS